MGKSSGGGRDKLEGGADEPEPVFLPIVDLDRHGQAGFRIFFAPLGGVGSNRRRQIGFVADYRHHRLSGKGKAGGPAGGDLIMPPGRIDKAYAAALMNVGFGVQRDGRRRRPRGNRSRNPVGAFHLLAVADAKNKYEHHE